MYLRLLAGVDSLKPKPKLAFQFRRSGNLLRFAARNFHNTPDGLPKLITMLSFLRGVVSS